MNEALSSFARLGLVHHMLYAKSLQDPREHARTLYAMSHRDDIETFDCCLPYDRKLRRELAQAVRDSGKKNVVFATHMFPLRKLSFCSTNCNEQAQARMIVADMVEQAALMGATGFIFASGGPRPGEATPAHYEAFAGFCRWLCAELKPHGITALLEPFDMDFDKCFLMGSTRRCVELLESLDVDNIGIELDYAHLPLMGEEFREATLTVAPWLKRVHLGNCVMRDESDPFYGDNHPPIGYPGGEIDTPQLVEILSLLQEIGFLSKGKRGDLVVELNPFPGRSEDDSVADNFKRVEDAWKQVLRTPTLPAMAS
jgi:sugar phosphate isomerase/epimerase